MTGSTDIGECAFSTHICRTLTEMEATKNDFWAIMGGLGSNITKRIGDIELGRSIRIFAKDEENKVVGGIIGDVFGNYVYVAQLWVTESLRNKGHGTRLLNMLEEEATKLGCGYAHTDTYSFEARPFYERNGYELFGMLDDYVKGHGKCFLRKTLGTSRKPT
jgi:GNAT superfamily N-acetyltransferase